MTEVWLFSYVILWVLVIVLLMITIALARQIGLVYRRLPPTAARMTPEGPALGAEMALIQGRTLDSGLMAIGGPASRPRLYAFIGADCASCDELAPALRSIDASDRDAFDVVVVGLSGTDEDNRRFVDRNRLHGLKFAVTPEAIPSYGIQGTPYLMLVDEEGRVRTKGIANHLEQLESLIEGVQATRHTKSVPISRASGLRP